MSSPSLSPRGTLDAAGRRLHDLVAVLAEPVAPPDYPHAAELLDGVLVYDVDGLAAAPDTELVAALAEGPGVLVVRRALAADVVARATAEFDAMIAEQRRAGVVAGDHFARSGANDRVWNALRKLAERAPEVFVDYYACEVLARVSLAWPGPAYQVTSQVNVVNPGGGAQVGHRDYHLGFMAPEVIERYPEHVHRLSPLLTLQAAVAHSDMAPTAGPTCFLPGSQRYLAGYLAAVLHGAGANRTAGTSSMRRAVAAAAEGYPFPTDLDADPPRDGLAPSSQADLLRRALAQRWPGSTLAGELAALDRRRGVQR